jgi:hypothetical protein
LNDQHLKTLLHFGTQSSMAELFKLNYLSTQHRPSAVNL